MTTTARDPLTPDIITRLVAVFNDRHAEQRDVLVEPDGRGALRSRIVSIARELIALVVPAERTEAAQAEWERWKRANGVAAAGLRTCADELRRIAKRQESTADERDLERMAATHDELAIQLDGENWLKSPKAMAELRASAQADGHPNNRI